MPLRPHATSHTTTVPATLALIFALGIPGPARGEPGYAPPGDSTASSPPLPARYYEIGLPFGVAFGNDGDRTDALGIIGLSAAIGQRLSATTVAWLWLSLPYPDQAVRPYQIGANLRWHPWEHVSLRGGGRVGRYDSTPCGGGPESAACDNPDKLHPTVWAAFGELGPTLSFHVAPEVLLRVHLLLMMGRILGEVDELSDSTLQPVRDTYRAFEVGFSVAWW